MAVTDAPTTRGDQGGLGINFFRNRAERIAREQGRVTTMVASGKRIDVTNPAETVKYKKRRKEWQNEAWAYYDTVPEIWFSSQFVGNCLRRMRLYPAYIDPEHPDQPPIPIDLSPETPAGEPGQTPDTSPHYEPAEMLQRQAIVELDRLKNGTGGHADMLFGFGLNLGIAGDCTLVGRTIKEEGQPATETWKVYSNDQLRVNATGEMAIMTDPEDKEGTILTGNDLAVRVWRPHPRWDLWADSPMKALLDTCDELSILGRQIRSGGRTRLNAGWVVIPEEADLKSVNPLAGQEGGEGREASPFIQDLVEAMTTPIQDEGSASAVVPFIIQMKADLIEKIKQFKFDREYDKLSIELRKELITRIANGLDIPAEVLLGMADLNHWTAWQIDEQTFKAHIEPLILMICQALTVGYLWPALGGLGVPDVQNIVVWYDPSALVGHPNRGQDAKDAHTAFAISDSALRRYLGFSEEDAPSPDEIAEMMRRRASIRITDPTGYPKIDPNTVGYPNATPEINRGHPIGQQITTTPGQPAAIPAPAAGASTVKPGPPPSGPPQGLTAAGAPRVATLGRRLTAIDTRLRTQLLTTADAAVFRSVEMAGAQIRRKIGRAAASKKIDGVPNNLVVFTVGKDVTLRVAGDTALMTGLDETLTQRYTQLVNQSQARVRQILAEYDPDLDLDQLAQRQASDSKAGLALLLTGVTLLANNLLFNGPIQAPAQGEFDASTSVPAGLVRQALARAGGAPQAPTPGGAILGADGEPVGGVATGTTALDILRASGLSLSEYTWTTGAPNKPFDQHQDLDGISFSSFHDDVLAADPGEWPFVDFYHPGDHLYCQCDFEIAFQEES